MEQKRTFFQKFVDKSPSFGHLEGTVSTTQEVSFSTRIRICAGELARLGVSALGQLYDLTAPRLVRYALTLTRNRDDAEDALQAAMVRIALRPRALAQANFPWAYFLKVVRNEALNINRRRKSSPLLTVPVDERDEGSSAFEQMEIKLQVRQALERLPRLQSEVVVLKIWEEMTFAEIGEVLGESPNTVASRYRYALQKLTQHLQPLSDEVFHGR